MYHALYRKYRPVDFNSVVGQDSIIKTLKNSIKNHNFSHAYMFFGPRGTGKTTVSKIFARNINCLNSNDGIACEECSACKVSFSKDCVDIIEIDAASNNGVDEIRDLKNKISLVPSELKYKVYIIDEVHMLSIGAFNALLKTLEEPPEHAIFILATTDPQKVPETIISRCQCFSFKRISDKAIVDRLKYVCSSEDIDVEEDVLENIALLSDGGLRDALGSLDKLVSYTENKITIDDFNEVNGVISSNDMDVFLSDILSGNIPNVLTSIAKFNDSGKNLIQIMSQLINFSRDIVVNYYISNKEYNFSIDVVQNFVNILNEKMFDIKKSGNTKIYIEMLLLKFINDYVNLKTKIVEKNNYVKEINKNVFVTNNNEVTVNEEKINNDNVVENNKDGNNDDVEEKNSMKDSNIEISYNKEEITEENFDNKNPKIINIDAIMKIRVNNILALANKNLLRLEMNNFEVLRDYSFDQEIGYIICGILDGKLRAVSSDAIIISYEYDSNVKQNLYIIDKIEDVYNKITNSNKKIAIISDDYWEKVKQEYINDLRNGIKYEVEEEPRAVYEELKNDDIITSSAVSLFGDIVEID
ncbi:MAG: DNA polymerase III subunit gamma/tau [Mollicutes bacterium]|nr:DNA polymerase III subunit gamma/tau [Mollicutes bacterium]